MDLLPKRNTRTQGDKRSSPLLESKPAAPLKSTAATARRERRGSRLLAFFVGIVVGALLALLLFVLFLVVSPDGSMKSSSHTPSSGSITTEISRNYLTLFISRQLSSSGLPGNVRNVQVVLATDNEVTVSADDQLSVLGLSVTKRVTISLQLSIVSCQPHATIIHVDLAGIPLTSFAPLFEGQLNQQLQSQQSGLPSGFSYCVTGIQTGTNSIVMMYTATPTAS